MIIQHADRLLKRVQHVIIIVIMDAKRLLLAVGVVAFVVIVSVAIFKIDWGGGSTPVVDLGKKTELIDYASTGAQVRVTARGPIISNQEHQDIQITVGQTETVGLLMSGYQGTVAQTQKTPNNQASFKDFLSALQNANFTRVKLPRTDQQYDGACSDGTRYTFEFINAGADAPGSTWATSCSKKDGTFDGDLSEVKKLFSNQLPEDQFDDLTNNINLSF